MPSQLQFHQDFIVDTDKVILKFTWENKGSKRAKIFFGGLPYFHKNFIVTCNTHTEELANQVHSLMDLQSEHTNATGTHNKNQHVSSTSESSLLPASPLIYPKAEQVNLA